MDHSYKSLPIFRRRQHEPAEYLYESDVADVRRDQGEVYMTLGRAPWKSEFENFMVRYEVGHLFLDAFNVNSRLFDFLLQHRPLRELKFLLYDPVDLRPLLILRQLRHLYINWKHENPPSYEMEFTRLSLESCHLQLFPQFDSMLDCRTVRSLSADFGYFIKTKLLDGSRLPQLCELSISGPTKLERFQIHPDAELTALEIVSCSHLTVDWSRVARDLIHLSLAGRIGFPVAEIRAAKKLRTLMFTEMRKQDLQDLTFLLEMPSLKAVDVFPGRNLSKQSDSIVRRINEAGGHGLELSTKVGTYEQNLM